MAVGELPKDFDVEQAKLNLVESISKKTMADVRANTRDKSKSDGGTAGAILGGIFGLVSSPFTLAYICVALEAFANDRKTALPKEKVKKSKISARREKKKLSAVVVRQDEQGEQVMLDEILIITQRYIREGAESDLVRLKQFAEKFPELREAVEGAEARWETRRAEQIGANELLNAKVVGDLLRADAAINEHQIRLM
jgi:hypothetical protein